MGSAEMTLYSIDDFISSFKGDKPGHEFRGNQYDGSSGSGPSPIRRAAFEHETLPGKKMRFGDTVTWMDSDSKIHIGKLSGPGNENGVEIRKADGSVHHIKKDELRMPKGSRHVRDES
jgi:hypothetical protein